MTRDWIAEGVRCEPLLEEQRRLARERRLMSDAPMPIASALELLVDVQTRPVWDGAPISPASADYPRGHLDWHEGHGFVFQCYEHEETSSDFSAQPLMLRAECPP